MLQDPYDDYEKERKAESAYLRRLTFGFAIFVGFILMLAAGIAMGAPKAQSAEECMTLADMTLVARALAVHNIPREKADEILSTVYVMNSPRAEELMRVIGNLAYSTELNATDAANNLGQTCMRTGGNMDAILGSDV